MATFNETAHDGGFIVSEANGTRSRETVTVGVDPALSASGTFAYNPGQVLKAVGGVMVEFTAGATAAGVLVNGVTGSVDATYPSVAIVRDAEINGGEIEWYTGASAGEITAGKVSLGSLGVISR